MSHVATVGAATGIGCVAHHKLCVSDKGIAYPVATYAVLGLKQDAERDATVHLRLDLDPERMTEDERRVAAEKLRALGLLERGAKPNG